MQSFLDHSIVDGGSRNSLTSARFVYYNAVDMHFFTEYVDEYDANSDKFRNQSSETRIQASNS